MPRDAGVKLVNRFDRRRSCPSDEPEAGRSRPRFGRQTQVVRARSYSRVTGVSLRHRRRAIYNTPMYESKTKQIESTHAWTYAGLQVDASGACYAAERNGLRDIKPKGLLVRYPNPFAGGGEPEVLYQTSDSFQHYWRSPAGEHHILGKKHHFEVKGKFKTKEVTQRAQRLTRIKGFGNRLLITYGWPAAYNEIVGGEYKPLDIGLTELCEDLDGSGPEDIYVSSSVGIVHFDGGTWRQLANAPKHANLACVSRDEVYTTGVEPEQGLIFALYRGNARTGFKGLVPCTPADGGYKAIVPALGSIYLMKSHGESRGLYRFTGTTIEQVMHATAYTGRAAGNADVLWVENGIELLCFNGKTWKQVPRVMHDKSKG
jgi:hypothetical protein